MIYLPETLVKVKRGNIIESVHYGDVAVVDHKGGILFSKGNPDNITFLRSAAKPLQAAAALLRSVDVRYGLNCEEVAFLCSSHSGEKRHVCIAENVLKKLGLNMDELRCDSAFPIDKDTTYNMICTNVDRSPIYNNCSGKHMAMLAVCSLMGWDKNTYFLPEHPLQQYMREVVGKFCDIEAQNVLIACDGCGVPVHGVTVRKMACAYERLAAANFEDEQYRAVCRKIVTAMTENPYIIAGSGRFDYQLAEAFKGKLIAKTGADGVFCIGMPEARIGIAIKIHDGSQRGMETVILRILKIMDLLPAEQEEALSQYEIINLYNHRKEIVGKICPAF